MAENPDMRGDPELTNDARKDFTSLDDTDQGTAQISRPPVGRHPGSRAVDAATAKRSPQFGVQ
jgi:hypothetical protein